MDDIDFEDGLFEEDLGDLPSGLRVGDPVQAEAHSQANAVTSQAPAQLPPRLPNPLPSVLAPAPTTTGSEQSSYAAQQYYVSGNTNQGQPLPPLVAQPARLPVKRPRGRPRKVVGTDNRTVGTSAGSTPTVRTRGTGVRGRPRGRVRSGAARSRKRVRGSSEEEDVADESMSSDAETERNSTVRSPTVLNMQEEMPDDYNPAQSGAPTGPTTKYGRKISKPQPFVPSNKPNAPRKKKPAVENPDAFLLCEVCRGGHSTAPNRLVICEACAKGWHQLCHDPQINNEVVDSDLTWFCTACDHKLAASHPLINVNEGKWVAGYTVQEKREWMEHLPLHSLIGFIISVEDKYMNRLPPPGFEIWPADLPAELERGRQVRAAAEERRLKSEGGDTALDSEGPPSSISARPSPIVDSHSTFPPASAASRPSTADSHNRQTPSQAPPQPQSHFSRPDSRQSQSQQVSYAPHSQQYQAQSQSAAQPRAQNQNQNQNQVQQSLPSQPQPSSHPQVRSLSQQSQHSQHSQPPQQLPHQQRHSPQLPPMSTIPGPGPQLPSLGSASAKGLSQNLPLRMSSAPQQPALSAPYPARQNSNPLNHPYQQQRSSFSPLLPPLQPDPSGNSRQNVQNIPDYQRRQSDASSSVNSNSPTAGLFDSVNLPPNFFPSSQQQSYSSGMPSASHLSHPLSQSFGYPTYQQYGSSIPNQGPGFAFQQQAPTEQQQQQQQAQQHSTTSNFYPSLFTQHSPDLSNDGSNGWGSRNGSTGSHGS